MGGYKRPDGQDQWAQNRQNPMNLMGVLKSLATNLSSISGGFNAIAPIK
jgi:hypothetical protein